MTEYFTPSTKLLSILNARLKLNILLYLGIISHSRLLFLRKMTNVHIVNFAILILLPSLQQT